MNIKVNGVTYENFVSAKVKAGMGQLAREFEFVAASRGIEDIPFRCGDFCEIYDEKDKLLTGYIDKISTGSSGKGHTYTLSGRDLMGDVIDSNLPRMDSFDVPLPQVCQLVLDFLGINAGVVDLAGTQDRPFGFIIAAEPEDTGGEFLSQLARRKRVLLQSDGNGNMVITEGIGLKTDNQLINRIDGVDNNMLSASLTVDHSHRFGRYTTEIQISMATSQNLGKNIPPDSIVSAKYFLTDPNIRATRFRTTASDYNLGLDEALDRPKWEIGLNRAESIKYTVTVPGFRNWKGDLWELNTAPTVIDEYNGILDKKMLVSKIEYSIDGTGKTTRMVLTDKDAFKAELKIRKEIEIDGRAAT
jgi:prophage tail gpP-like protein